MWKIDEWLRSHGPIDPLYIRHGARLSLAVFLGSMLSILLQLPQGYWVPMTVVIVLGTTIGGTLRKAVQRFLGTLIGLVVGTALTYSTDILWLQEVILIAALFVAYYLKSYIIVNYGVFVVPITVMMVIALSVTGTQSPMEVLQSRTLDTVIGLLIALTATLLILPSRVSARITMGKFRVRKALADYLNAITRLYCHGEKASDGATRAKRQLERAMMSNHLLFPESRYELLETSKEHAFLSASERTAQTLLGLHNVARGPIEDGVRQEAGPILQKAAQQIEHLLRGEPWEKTTIQASLFTLQLLVPPLSHQELRIPSIHLTEIGLRDLFQVVQEMEPLK